MSILEITDVDKRYGGVRALAGASLSVEEGEVHGLLGPNGSGKSTLNKVLTGAVRADRATIRINGEDVVINGPRDAYRHGIASVYQHLALVDQLTVFENMVLGTEDSRFGWLTPREQRGRVQAMLDRLAPALEPKVRLGTRMERLQPGTRQLLEFGKAVLKEPRFLVLDEATASLRNDQVAVLFEMVRELTATGVSVVFVSHRMDEVAEICERATIIRNGRNVATVSVADTSASELITLMVGETAAQENTRREGANITEDVALEIDGLEAPGVKDVSLKIHAGEVLGLGGLQGQGQSDLLLALFGAQPVRGGSIAINGRQVSITNPRKAVAAGVALVPGDRGAEGLYALRSIQENLSTATMARRAAGGFALSMRKERQMAREQVEALQIKIGGLDDPVSSLSGGNQQKVVIGKWLPANPDIVLLDDPTKGVDVGAKGEIYKIIRSLTDRGVAVILNSSDDMELIEETDRVVVFYEGRIVRELKGEEITHDSLIASALRMDNVNDDDTTVDGGRDGEEAR